MCRGVCDKPSYHYFIFFKYFIAENKESKIVMSKPPSSKAIDGPEEFQSKSYIFVKEMKNNCYSGISKLKYFFLRKLELHIVLFFYKIQPNISNFHFFH